MNERALRNVVVGLGGTMNGVPRADAFDITVASETMAIFCLASSVRDLKERLGRIIVAYNRKGEPVIAESLKGHGAMAVLLRDALQPNLVQTLEGVPAFVHGGPFANIAHGCNSLIATRLALKTADYVVTEAGFGADLGAEKFFNIKCRAGNLKPRATVLVATMRALRWHGGVARTDVLKPNLDAVKRGIVNLEKHIKNIAAFGVPCVVALNRFSQDSDEEIKWVLAHIERSGAEVALSEVWEKGGEGGLDLARRVVEAVKKPPKFRLLYDVKESIPEKISKIATTIYGASDVKFSPAASKMVARLESFGLDKLPICTAKTQYSLSDNPKLLGHPRDFSIQVSSIRPSAGAGFLVALTGDIMTMPGLPRVPCAEAIDLDDEGRIKGLF
jgi:formate--tetrahydrofolate ligase